MCLQTDWLEPKVAEEDMTVYKVLKSEEDDTYEGQALVYAHYSPFYRMKYELGKVYSTTMRIAGENSGSFDHVASDARQMFEKEFPDQKYLSISEGFHSALTFERLDDLGRTGEFVHECIIPKGSMYYIGFTDLVVSNQIIVKKQVQ